MTEETFPHLPDNLSGRLRSAELNSKTALTKFIEMENRLTGEFEARLNRVEATIADQQQQIQSLKSLVVARMGTGATA